MITHKLLLTFDVEDFISPNAIAALHTIMKILNKYKLKAIFFITGLMAEKLGNFPEIIDLLKNHEIGFHSSSHSVRPIIPEYTDIKSYKEAYAISLERETSHINPLTGKPEREGGIYFLQDLFHPKKIEAYRAPGESWTPLHIEALTDLGIKYDFSSSITASEPVHYRRITFYPCTFTQQWDGSRYDYQCLISAILKRKIAVLDIHLTLYVNLDMWDSTYYKGNPPSLLKARERHPEEVASLFTKFELLLNQIRFLQRIKLIEVNPNLNASSKKLATNKNEVERCYEKAIRWPKRFFNYNPRFILSHFYEFFEKAYQ